MGRKEVLAAVSFLLWCGAAAVGVRYYYRQILPEQRLDQAYDAQARLFGEIKPAETAPEKEALSKAEAVNPNTAAWLTIPGTHIDYPIAQAGDNEFYLHNGFDGRYNNELGCPFLDYRCAGDFSGFNSIVYAHNMTEQRMFADIALYKDSAYMQAHPTGTLILKDGTHSVQFFAYLTTYSTAPAYHAVFITAAEKQEYIDYIFENANYSTVGADAIQTDAHFLLLSTCTFEYDDARGILIGIIE